LQKKKNKTQKNLQDGGVISATASTILEIVDSQLISNTATGSGGAIKVDLGTFSITNSVFGSNVASMGGALYANAPMQSTLIQSTFELNTASQGGGLWAVQADMIVSECEFDSNSADEDGGAAFLITLASSSAVQVLVSTVLIAILSCN
jgi:predicted outer membrane repeat protein